MPNSDALAASTQQLVQGALLRWLEELIVVEAVTVEATDSSLNVTVIYARRDTGIRHRLEIVSPLLQRDDNSLSMGCRDLTFVDHEGLVSHDRFIAWGQKRRGEQAQDFIRPVPENNLIQGHLPSIP